jgi:hypothetical protein
MPPKILKEANLVAFYSRPYPGSGGAFKPPKYCTALEKEAPKNCFKSAAAAAIDAAGKIAENQRIYREAESSPLDSPVASAPRPQHCRL